MSKKTTSWGGNAAGRDVRNEESNVIEVSFGARPPSAPAIVGNGNTGNIMAGGDVHVTTASRARPKIVIQPGPEHLIDEQKVTLAELRGEWMTLHAAIKKKPLSHGVAWGKINRSVGATSYHLILQSRFADAIAYIKQEMAKLRGMRSAPAKDSEWRVKRIGAIKARCKNQLGDPDAYRAYIKKNFKAESLADLATDELQKTYTYIMAKKQS